MSTPTQTIIQSIALAGALACTPQLARAAPSVSVEDLVAACEGGFPQPDGPSASQQSRRSCIIYLDGVIATVAQLAALAAATAREPSPGGAPPAPVRAVFCVPGEESYERMSRAFLNFAKVNPGFGGRAAASLVVAAFAQGYPCR